MCEKEQEIISPSSPLDSIRVVWGTHVLYLCSQPSTVQPDCQSPERTRIGRSVTGTYFLSQMRAFTLVCTCDRCESIWRHSLNLQQAPPGTGECLASCGQSVLPVLGWQKPWCHWLALMILWPKSNWTPIEYVSLHPMPSGSITGCLWAQWCPDLGQEGVPPGHHLPTYQEHTQTLLGMHTGMWGP